MSDMTTCLNDLSYIPMNNEQNEPTQGDIGETSNNLTQAKRNEFKELYASANEELYPGCDYFFQNVFPIAKGYMLPQSYYAIKKTFKTIGVGWKESNTPGKKVPKKVLRYFSVIPRLQHLYKSSHTAKEMTWHATGKCTEPEPRNVRLGLAADGFNPFESSFMPTLLIPSPKSSGKDIDVYLRPLIDDLKDLWAKPGVETIDAKQLMLVLGKTAYVGHKRFLKKPQKWRRSLKFNGETEDKDPPREFSRDAIMTQLARLPTRVKGKHPRCQMMSHGVTDGDGGVKIVPLLIRVTHRLWGFLGNRGKRHQKAHIGWQESGRLHTSLETQNPRTQFDLRPHMEFDRWPQIYEGIQQHLQKIYNGEKGCSQRSKLGLAQLAFWNDPQEPCPAAQNNKSGKEQGRCASGIPDEMLRLQGLGSNTPSGVPYTDDEIMAIVRRGKQRGHIPGVGRVLPGQGTVIPPPPPCTHSSDVAKLKKSEKRLTKQVNMFMRLFRSDDKFSQMLTQLKSQPEYGGGSGSGGCRDDEPRDDEDDGEDGEDEDDSGDMSPGKGKTKNYCRTIPGDTSPGKGKTKNYCRTIPGDMSPGKASLACTLAMAADAFQGFRKWKLWFPNKFFVLNTVSITLIAIAMKLPVDLTNDDEGEWRGKIVSISFLVTMLANLLPSLGLMDDKELLVNMVAWAILLITITVNVSIQTFAGILDPTFSLLLFFSILWVFSIAFTVPASRRILEHRYKELHRLASYPQDIKFSYEELEQRDKKS
ncbi:reverse transcriptase domain-containing protein [Tanacetum coccineum]